MAAFLAVSATADLYLPYHLQVFIAAMPVQARKTDVTRAALFDYFFTSVPKMKTKFALKRFRLPGPYGGDLTAILLFRSCMPD